MNGHSLTFREVDDNTPRYVHGMSRDTFHIFQEHYNATLPEVERRLGTFRAHKVQLGNHSLFPNGILGLRLALPRGPLKTEFWHFVLVEKDAPEAIKHIIRTGSQANNGAAGLFEQDDIDNWRQVTTASRSRIARQYPQDLSMGIGHAGAHPDYPGLVSERLHLRKQPAALLFALAGVHECRELGGHPPRPDHGPLRGHGYHARIVLRTAKRGRRGEGESGRGKNHLFLHPFAPSPPLSLIYLSEDNEVMPTSAQTATVMVTPQQALWLELMQFYIREAWLLDERKFTEWLDLFTEDVLYFMPRRKNVPRRELHREVTPLGDLALFEDDKRYLEMRVARLDTGMAWAEDPPSRTRHLIGNLVVEPLDNDEVQARTAFLVYRSHLETDQQLSAGSREDVLRQVNGAWKVAKRTIVLDANVLLDKNLSIFF